MKINVLKNNGSSGELSPRIFGRTDSNQYQNAFARMSNFLCKKTGGVYNRSGSLLVVEQLEHVNKSRLKEFQVNIENTYTLEFGNQLCRPIRNGSVLYEPDVALSSVNLANPLEITPVTMAGFAVGDYIDLFDVVGTEEINARTFKIVSLGATFFSVSDVAGNLIDATGYDAYISGGSILKHVVFSTPYTSDDLANLKFAQSADTMFITHPDHDKRILTRNSDTDWDISVFSTIDGPYQKQNSEEINLTASGTTGSVTITSDVSLFASTDINRQISITVGSTRGWGTITGFTDAQNVTVSLSSDLGGTTATQFWRLGAFSETTGYPAHVTLHENRLFFGYTDTDQNLFWSSKIDDLNNFAPTNTDLTVEDDNAVTFALGTGEFDAITFLKSGSVLYIGTVGGPLTATGTNGVITPSNIQVNKPNGIGSNALQPVLINNSLIYVTRTGRQVREYIFSYDEQSFTANDLSVIAEHLFREGDQITEMVYHLHPDGNVYFLLDSGRFIGMLFDREQNVVGFHPHQLGGTFEKSSITDGFTVEGVTYRIKNNIGGADFTSIGASSNDIGTEFIATGISPTWGSGELAEVTHAVVESLSVAPSESLNEDNIYFSVKRTINGETRRYIEYSSDEYISEHKRDYVGMDYLDSALSYSGTATDEIGNLYHLEGETVTVLANYGDVGDLTVTNGRITLPVEATDVKVGLPYRSFIEILPVELSLQSYGNTTKDKRRLVRGYVKMENSIGVKHGRSLDNLRELPFRKDTDYMDLPPPLFNGIKDFITNQNTTRDGTYFLVQDSPYPCNIIYMGFEMEVNN